MWERVARAQREPVNATEQSKNEHFNWSPTAIQPLSL